MTKLNLKLALFLFTAILTLTNGCKKPEEIKVETENYKGILVVNEGKYGASNGSIGLFKNGNNTYFNAFEKANNRPLGDIVQSINKLNNKFYIAVNNSNKIEIVNADNFNNESTISVSSPRYILPINPNKAYISHLYSNEVSILNLQNNSVSGKINIDHWSENMALINSKAFVGTNSKIISVINTSTDKLIDSILVGNGLNKIIDINNNKGVALSTGLVDYTTGNVLENGKLVFFSADSNKTYNTINLSSGSYGGSMATYGSTIYYTLGDNKLYSINTDGTNNQLFLSLASGTSIYGLNVDPKNGWIYITDAKDYNSAGKIYIYNASKQFVKEFTSGIVPNNVFFNE